MRRRQLLAICTAGVTAGVLAGCGDDEAAGGDRGAGGATALETVYPVGRRPAGPTLSGALLDGTAFEPATWSGKVVVVNFWASWCAPCRAETDDLEAVYQATRERGVEFLGLNIRDSKDAAIAFVRGRVAYPSLFDPSGQAALAFNQVSASTLPATVLLDRQHRVAAVYRKALIRTELEPVVVRLAAEQA